MNDLVEALSVVGMGAIVVRSSILLVCGLVATRLLRRASSALRHLVWAVTLGGAVLVPILSPLLPPLRLPLPAISLDDPRWREIAPPALAGSPAEDAAGVAATSRGRPEALATPSTGDRRATSGWLVRALLLWMTGVLIMAARLLVGVAGVWTLSRRATMMTDGAWLHLAHDLARRLGLKRGVTLMQGDRGLVPMTWGVLQPVIWVPAEAAAWSPERRAVVLAHELAHVRRRDALVQWIGHLALAVYWFNPLVWIATRRLHEERERACDDAVLRMGTAPTRYADHLLEVVRSLGKSPAPAAAMAMGRRSHFEGRIRAILDRAAPRDAIGARGAAAIGTLAVGLILPVAALSAERAGTVPPGVGGPIVDARETEALAPVPASAARVEASAGDPAGPERAGRGPTPRDGGPTDGASDGLEPPALATAPGEGDRADDPAANASSAPAGALPDGTSSTSDASASASGSASAAHSASATTDASGSRDVDR